MKPIAVHASDSLVVVDVQNDFLPGGSLAVPCGDEVVPRIARMIRVAAAHDFPIFATRDWHPPAHASFRDRGGPWPPHCVQGTRGAELAEALDLPTWAVVVSKGTDPDRDAYSGFDGTNLDAALRALRVRRLLVAGLATEHCVLRTVADALSLGYRVLLLRDAIRPLDAREGARAELEMARRGAVMASTEELQ
jgi:nicotinamidase/pyrazinamidase